jgi:hypothetical protein
VSAIAERFLYSVKLIWGETTSKLTFVPAQGINLPGHHCA